jgi:uncharacterized membrane protein YdjX (TVP38/TMEM64 family)
MKSHYILYPHPDTREFMSQQLLILAFSILVAIIVGLMLFSSKDPQPTRVKMRDAIVSAVYIFIMFVIFLIHAYLTIPFVGFTSSVQNVLYGLVVGLYSTSPPLFS